MSVCHNQHAANGAHFWGLGGETIQRRLRLDAAEDARDALAKAVYAALFRWLVTRVNSSLAVGKNLSGMSLSILDIYGFECFMENSFEQLCINYANERLQQQFNRLVDRPGTTCSSCVSSSPILTSWIP